MPFNYRGYDLNSAGDKDWAVREQNLFKALIDTALDRVPNGNYSATSAPNAMNDASAGYIAGSLWIYGSNIYVCASNAIGNATWDLVNTQSLSSSSINVNNTYTNLTGHTLSELLSALDTKLTQLSQASGSGLLSNFSAQSIPSSTDDGTKGYANGSLWVYNNHIFMCINNTTNSAIWDAINLEVVASNNVNISNTFTNLSGSTLTDVLSSIDSAVAKTKDYFSDFSTQNVDTSSDTVIYVGKENKTGVWVVKRITMGSMIQMDYAMQSNNQSYTTYPLAWTNHLILNFNRLSQI